MKIILAGDNDFALQKRLHKLTAKFINNYDELALERLNAEDLTARQLNDSVNSVPFLSQKKMIVITGVTNKDLLEAIADIEVPDSTDLVISVSKLDKRALYYKKLSKQNGFELFEKSQPRDLPIWIAQYVKEQGGTISGSDARILLDRIGPDQMRLSSEIDKLLTYNNHITKESIELLTELTSQSSVFQLLDAAFAGRLDVVEKLYKQQRAQKVEPVLIVGTLSWQLHILALIKAAGSRSSAQIAKEAKINPYTVSKSQTIAKKMSMSKIKQLVSDLHQLDIDLKSKRIDADAALLNYLLSIGE